MTGMSIQSQWSGVWAAAAGLSGLPQPSLQKCHHNEKKETRQQNELHNININFNHCKEHDILYTYVLHKCA
jgi:hypothetical protein